jgi:NPCBM/NEW2 domain
LTPSRYEQRPFLGASWPLAKDAAATEQPLRLTGNTFEKGVGVHAPARVSYKLDGKYERFDALVGIDETARRGRARVALELDGKRIDLHEGKELSAKDEPVVVRQTVRDVRELTLIVEVGAFGDVQANVNWSKARLVNKR